MCTLFANLCVFSTWGPNMVYMGSPYIFYNYMIKCDWLGYQWRAHIILLTATDCVSTLDWLMSPQFPIPPQWPITDQFPLTPILCRVFECLVPVCIERFIECSGVLLTTKFAYRKGVGTFESLLCVVHTEQSALESRQGLELFRSTSVLLFTGLSDIGFFSNYALWELEVLCCLFRLSASLIGSSMSWWMVVGENWLTSWCQECLWEVFFVSSCSSCTAFLYTREQALWLCWRLHFGSCCVVPRWESSCCKFVKSWSWQG